MEEVFRSVKKDGIILWIPIGRKGGGKSGKMLFWLLLKSS